MPPPKLHLNEHLSPRLAEQLRKYGFDATSTLELNMVEAVDIYAKWYRRYFYFCAKYCSPAPNALSPFF